MAWKIEDVKHWCTWFGHDAFRIATPKGLIYIDPFQLSPGHRPADLILLTHEHYDHFSPDDFTPLTTASTTIIGAASISPPSTTATFIAVRPGDQKTIQGITIKAVPAYNIGKKFHPQGEPRVGFVITVDGIRIYHAGDTDFIPEMKQLREIDVALVPVSGTYVMTADEAAEAVNTFKPKLAIPMHYGAIVGHIHDAERFKKLAKVPVQIFTPTASAA